MFGGRVRGHKGRDVALERACERAGSSPRASGRQALGRATRRLGDDAVRDLYRSPDRSGGDTELTPAWSARPKRWPVRTVAFLRPGPSRCHGRRLGMQRQIDPLAALERERAFQLGQLGAHQAFVDLHDLSAERIGVEQTRRIRRLPPTFDRVHTVQTLRSRTGRRQGREHRTPVRPASRVALIIVRSAYSTFARVECMETLSVRLRRCSLLRHRRIRRQRNRNPGLPHQCHLNPTCLPLPDNYIRRPRSRSRLLQPCLTRSRRRCSLLLPRKLLNPETREQMP